ncbi:MULTISPECIES: hypothetical protein [Mammaliicoccus]|uniref:Uncharacterized protein n=1 Tax=Mammaliicoccus fleurettii TaxID=150056 RepID=A0ABS5MPC3_9STAP|nr:MULTISPECIES: hypothetical protein [Mammaliicoccus]MBL0848011.1 hypothetical protein [Mammaliicoccus fleurettii]MBS3672769.1 hypothetical protein [Mammaliicoccus fleurettii]MBS3697770.1 hypothetical protein [Mammaliicoccus fleurettii]MEB6200847.1 hypothetical protein [Mammaliicoccus fleurettii]SUM35504.1 Uncharacterised protein [Mammaliicoccus fleurettii]
MVMKHGKDYYEDISDDLLYVSQEINQKISDDVYNLSEELDTIKEIIERLESPSD